MLAPINQWGTLPFPLPRLTAHSQSGRVRDILDGNPGGHRHLPIPADGPDDGPSAAPTQADQSAAVDDRGARQRVWHRRQADLDRLADVADVLTDIDRQVADLQGRVTALLNREI